MRLVVIESPFAGDVEANRAYAIECLRDSLSRGEAPFASHVLYTEALDDTQPKQRVQGINAGFAWGERAELRVFYVDRGISAGMRAGYFEAVRLGQSFELRALRGEDQERRIFAALKELTRGPR